MLWHFISSQEKRLTKGYINYSIIFGFTHLVSVVLSLTLSIVNATNILDAKPETSGTGTKTQKCLCQRFKEIYLDYFGPFQESMCVCVYVYVDFVTVSAGSNRPLLCLNKLTPQPNLRQLIMWACIHSCVSMSKCFCLFMCCFIPHPLYSYTSHNMCRVIGALKLTAYQLVFVYYFFKLVDNAFCTVTQVVVYFVNAYSY